MRFQIRRESIARRFQSARKVKALSIVVLRNVLLHLWRLFRTVSAWKIAGDAIRQDSIGRGNPRRTHGHGGGHGSPQPYDLSFAHPAASSESLDEYCFGFRVFGDRDSGHTGQLALLCFFGVGRDRPYAFDHLVCLDLAETTSTLKFD